jgi:hypothetical protein
MRACTTLNLTRGSAWEASRVVESWESSPPSVETRREVAARWSGIDRFEERGKPAAGTDHTRGSRGR